MKILLVLLVMISAVSSYAVGEQSRDQEITLALSAEPEHLRADSTVYVLENGKYAKVRDGKSGFTCTVLRATSDSREPICFDAEGSRTNMLVDMRRTEWRIQGLHEDQIQSKVEEGYKKGEFSAPKRSGVVYMLSGENYIYNPETRKVFHYPPHLMFMAPYLKNADIGARMQTDSDSERPWVLSEGQPDAYIIVAQGDHQR